MAKYRKMLGEWNGENIQKLTRLIETQSIETLVKWTTDYSFKYLIAIYKKDFSEDERLEHALNTARDFLAGKIKMSAAKPIFKECFSAAKEAEKFPAAQAAARAIYAAVSTSHTPTMSISIAYYGAAAIAYDRFGIGEPPQLYDNFANEVFESQYNALKEVAVEDEPNPAKVNWNC
jgi:hypothetical protein